MCTTRDSINYNLKYFIMKMSGTKPMKNTMRKQSPLKELLAVTGAGVKGATGAATAARAARAAAKATAKKAVAKPTAETSVKTKAPAKKPAPVEGKPSAKPTTKSVTKEMIGGGGVPQLRKHKK